MNAAPLDSIHQGSVLATCRRAFAGLWQKLERRSNPRKLHLCESLSLGEKRFLAVVQVEAQQFLVGGGSNNVSLLARLGESPDFSEVLTEWCERQK
jgi:flagellar biogenesis protein FliO